MYEVEEINIENLIYNIRGKQVMLDRDLAKLYGCKNGTKSINLAVKRNIYRFPEDFCFQLTEEEYRSFQVQNETSSLEKNYSRFQFETLNNPKNNRGKNIKYMPYAFTEEGIAMLSSVLKTEIATKVSIKIMRTFVKLRRYIKINDENNRLTNLEIKYLEHDLKIDELFDRLSDKETNNHIFFDGQIYDSYSKIVDVFNKAKNELIIVDGYADKIVLDIISRLKVKVILITKRKSLLNKMI